MIVTDGIGQTPCSFQHYLVYINFWLPKIGRFPLTLIVALTMVLRTNVPHCDSILCLAASLYAIARKSTCLSVTRMGQVSQKG